MTHSCDTGRVLLVSDEESRGLLTAIVEFGAPRREIVDEIFFDKSENDDGEKGRLNDGNNAAALVASSEKQHVAASWMDLGWLIGGWVVDFARRERAS
jgi:hypothetical protein